MDNKVLELQSHNTFPSGYPALKLVTGSFHVSADQPLFGAIGDSAPDRWGRLLMYRSERKNAEHEKRTARALKEINRLR